MIDLSDYGMDLKFDERKGELVGFSGERGVRKLSEMREMFPDPGSSVEDLYFMFRGVDEFDDIRYDITALSPGMVGDEYIKTKGHYHPDAFPEVYEVMSGRAYYLIQRSVEPFARVDDVILIKAKAGDKVLIPPHYGHVTINPSDSYLLMNNLVSKRFSSVYAPYERFRGAVYYMTSGGAVKNDGYTEAPELKVARPKEAPEFGLIGGKSLYRCISDDKGAFEYLNGAAECDLSSALDIQ